MVAYDPKRLEQIRSRNAQRNIQKGQMVANPRDQKPTAAQKETARMSKMNVTGEKQTSGPVTRPTSVAESRAQFGQEGTSSRDIKGWDSSNPTQAAKTMDPTSNVTAGSETPSMADARVSANVPEASPMMAQQSAQIPPQGQQGLPGTGIEPFDRQLQLGGMMSEAANTLAEADFTAQEASRRRQLERQLSQTTALEALQAEGAKFADLSLQELEDLAVSEGLDLNTRVRERLKQGGLAQIENMKLERQDRLAEVEFTKNKIEREFNRGITEREQFNVQQDTRLRRLLNTFGGGVVQDLAGNAQVMKAAEEGQRALDDLRMTYADQQTMLGRQADTVIRQYTNNVNAVEADMANTLENAYQGIMGRVDELLDQGVTNKTTLNKALFESKKDYVNLYNKVTTDAANYMQQQNQWLAEQQMKIQEQQWAEDKFMTEQTGSLFRNGKPITDQNGNPIPTFNALKEQNARDAELSRLTGTLYYNGQAVVDPTTGKPMSTLAARGQEFDQMLAQAKFSQDVNQFNQQFGLNLSKAQFDQMKFYADQDMAQARFAFEQAKEGIKVVDTGMTNPNFPGNVNESKYPPTVVEGGIQIPAQVQSKGGGKQQLTSTRRQCGAYVNDCFGVKVMGNTLQSKAAYATQVVPQPGSAFVLDNGAGYTDANGNFVNSGHTGMVEQVFPDGTVVISESNYDGQESFRRTTTSIQELQAQGLVGFTEPMISYPQPEQYQAGRFVAQSTVPAGAPGAMGTGSQAQDIALQIMRAGGDIFGLQDVKQDERYAVARELNNFMDAARQQNDIYGMVQASAAGSQLSDQVATKLTSLQDAVGNLNVLEEQLSDMNTGVFWKYAKANPWDADARQVEAVITATVPGLARGVFGETGVLTDNDIERYKATIPNLGSPDGVKKLVLTATRDFVKRSLTNTLKTQAMAGRNVSRFAPLLSDIGIRSREEIAAGVEESQSQLGISTQKMLPFMQGTQTPASGGQDAWQVFNFFGQ